MYEANKYLMKNLLISFCWVAFVILAGIVFILNGRGDGVHIAVLLVIFAFGMVISQFFLYRKCKDAIKSERKLHNEQQKIIEQERYKKELERNYKD